MFQSGILDKTKLFSNFLLVLLLASNIYLSIQFINNLQKPVLEDQTNVTLHIKATRFLKTFIDKVLNTQGTVSFEDRVQLENDILQIHDPVLTTAWKAFVGSKTSKDAQTNAVKLIALLVDRV
jgi:hypothetical protein